MPATVQIRRGYLDSDELTNFLDHSRDPHEKLLWLTMCDAGLRMAEALSLNWEDFKPAGIRVIGKGNKMRKVPVTSRLWTAYQLVCPHAGSEVDSKIWSVGSRSIQYRFERVLKRAKIGKKNLCPHSLRHTFATRSLVAGVDIHRVGTMLGHRSTSTTLGYLHTNDEALADAAKLLDRLNAIPESRADQENIQKGEN